MMRPKALLLAVAVFWSFTAQTASAAGPTPIDTGTAGDFVILSKTGITNVPTSAITGDIGASPITAAAMDNVTCTEITGLIYGADDAYVGSGDTTCFRGSTDDNTRVANAVLDMETAYTDAAGRTTPDFTELHDGDISGQTLVPGLYKWGTGVLISTDVTLSGGPNDVWIFQIAGDVIQADDSSVLLAGGAMPGNVFWQVAGVSGVAIGSTAHFEGVVLAEKAITLNTGATVNGRLLSQTEVTLIQNTITKPMSVRTLPTLMSLSDVNGDNNTDLGVLLRDTDKDRNRLWVMDGNSGMHIETVAFGSEQYRGFVTVPDATGDQIPEVAVLVKEGLFARIKDVVNKTLVGMPTFQPRFEPVALLAMDDMGGGVGPEVVVVGRNAATGAVRAQIKDVTSGSLINFVGFSRAFVPFDAVAVDNIGDSDAMEIAVLGIDAGGTVRVQVRDALTGAQISKFTFDKDFTPLFFAAVPNPAGEMTLLAVLGRNESGVIMAEVRRAKNGAKVRKIKFGKAYEPRAFLSFADSNGNGSGELCVVGVDKSGSVRAQTKEIRGNVDFPNIDFTRRYALVDAIAINGVAGTGLNEVAILGQNDEGQYRLQVKDLLTGANVNKIPLP
jgi:hypothetical protein